MPDVDDEKHDGSTGTAVVGDTPSDTATVGTRLMTADDLAVRWSVNRAHVYRLARDGQIPSIRVGKYFRFRLAAIECWEAEQAAASIRRT